MNGLERLQKWKVKIKPSIFIPKIKESESDIYEKRWNYQINRKNRRIK